MGSVGTPDEDTSHSRRALNGEYLACFFLFIHFLSCLFSAAHIRPRHPHYTLGNQVSEMYAAQPNVPGNNLLIHCN
jgi:hypothetical protein